MSTCYTTGIILLPNSYSKNTPAPAESNNFSSVAFVVSSPKLCMRLATNPMNVEANTSPKEATPSDTSVATKSRKMLLLRASPA